MRALAIALALSGCALAHERAVDAARDDAAGPHCEDPWRALPACPANAHAALGHQCFAEGIECGVACCAPGPPITCRAGRWAALDSMPDCSGVRCASPMECMGGGQCPPDQTCLVDTTVPDPVMTCVMVLPPFAAGWIDADARCRPTCTAHGSASMPTVIIAPTTALLCP